MLNKDKDKEDARGSTLLHLLSPAIRSLKLPRLKIGGNIQEEEQITEREGLTVVSAADDSNMK